MSDAEAKKEYEEIQAELAGKKGETIIEPEEIEKEVEKEEEKEPEEKDEDTDDDKSKDQIEEDEESEELDSTLLTRKPRTLLAKLQETKRIAKEEAEKKDREIADLRTKLETRETAEKMADDIKKYAEKHGKSEEEVMDLVAMMQKGMTKDDKAKPIIEKAEVLLKKEEAKEAFENEFSGLLEEFPETKDVKDAIRKEAYKEKNLDKSLYEIYLRYVKPIVIPKRKTGESSRGGQDRGNSKGEIDFAKIAENVKNNIPGALKDLTGEQQDKLFDWMQKNGSRYSR
jgi:hypothetical protein